MQLINRRNGRLLADEVRFADSFWGRFRGLMFRPRKDNFAMIFSKARAIHTFFVFFSIDLIYTDEGYRVVELKKGLRPFSWYSPKKRSRYLIELASGRVNEGDVRLGDVLILTHSSTSWPRSS